MSFMQATDQMFPVPGRKRSYRLHYDRWHGLSAAMVIMGCSGLMYAFAVYSDHIKIKFHYSQEQIDIIGAAKDFGAVIGVTSGIFYNLYPPWVTVCIGAIMHLFGYGMLWLTTIGDSASIWLLCFYVAIGSGGDSWVDTACMMSSLQNFEDYRGTAMGILKSQLGLSSAMFVAIYEAFLQPSVEKFLLMITLIPTILYSLLSVFISPSPHKEKDKDRHETMLIFRTIYFAVLILAAFLALSIFIKGRFHTGRSVMAFFVAVMMFISLMMYMVPVLGRYIASRNNISKSQVGEINLVPINTDFSNEKDYFEQKVDVYCKDSEEESLPLTANSVIQGENLQKTDSTSIIVSSELTDNIDLSFWQCLFAVDFWIVNFVVVSGAGSGLAIINNFAQIGTAARSGDVSLFVGVISVGSCLGRLTAGYVSDYLLQKGHSRPLCLLITQFTMTISCLLISTGGVFFLYIGAFLIGTGYGSYWTLTPAIISELFGIKHFAMLYKIIGICPTVGAYLLSAKVLGVFYDKQVILYQQNSETITTSGESICYGQQCFGFALVILSFICFIGVLASLWLIKRTYRLYSRRYHLLLSSKS